MRYERKIICRIEACSFCNITLQEYQEKNPNWEYSGFAQIPLKVIEYQTICPDCEKLKERSPDEFDKLCALKIKMALQLRDLQAGK